MNWRPDDWEETTLHLVPDMDSHDPDPMIAYKSFEAGADAYGEALKKKGTHVFYNPDTDRYFEIEEGRKLPAEIILAKQPAVAGYVVFLPAPDEGYWPDGDEQEESTAKKEVSHELQA